MSTSDKVAIVTGGGRGIGNAIVGRLVAEGYQVVTCGRGADRPKGLDPKVHYVQADVSNPVDATQLVTQAVQIGPLKALVNNAGVQVEQTVLDSTDDDWNAVIDTNCRGVFNMCRAALPVLMSNAGSIVNIGSMAGDVAETGMALYCASKGFVHSLTRALAVDHGPAIRCNTVSPGWILTELTDAAFEVSQNPEAAKADAISRHAAKRLGTPEDVAKTVAWLLSDDAAFITGQCLTVDGGLTIGSPVRPDLL